MKHISKKETRALEIIISLIDRHGFPPTVQEITDEMGLASKATAFDYLKRLERKGYIEREVSKPRALRVIKGVS